METVRRAGATYQDVLDAPENCVAELIAGELHLQPRPAKPHTRTATTLGVELGAKFDRGWLRVQTSEGDASVALSPFEGAALELEAIWPADA